MEIILENIKRQVVELTQETSQFISNEFLIFDRKNTEYKGFNNLVSYVDKEAEKRLVEGLAKILPESGFVAEEGTGESNQDGYNWIIDPLDGTTNFIHGVPVFSISIALMKGNDALIGVISDIMRDEIYSSVVNQGAFCNDKPIYVSTAKTLSESLLSTGYPYYDFAKLGKYTAVLNKLMQNAHGLRRMGSAALDLAYVARGRFEAFFEYNLNAWDVAAGVLLVKEAGGTVTDFKGDDNSIFGREIIASCKGVHSAVQNIIHQLFDE